MASSKLIVSVFFRRLPINKDTTLKKGSGNYKSYNKQNTRLVQDRNAIATNYLRNIISANKLMPILNRI